MALIVEDGSVVPNAESYVSVADADAYFVNHGAPTVWSDLDAAAKESALRYATQFIDNNYSFKGSIIDNDQALAWPRAGVYDNEGRSVAEDIVPVKVKNATCETALSQLTGNSANKTYTNEAAVKRKKIGPIETEFVDGASPIPQTPYIDNLLSPYTFAQSGIDVIRIERG